MERKVKDNHPVKGSIISVYPIRRTEDIDRIKRLLVNSPRDLLLFTLGINNGLRISDLLPLKVKDLKNLKPGEYLKIREKKTGKPNIVMVNRSVWKVLKSYIETCNLGDDEFLFKSRKGNQPLSVSSVNHLIKSWCKTINLEGNYGSHTLRKTFGYIQRVKYGISWEVLTERYNHTSPSVTRTYLGVDKKEVKKILLNEI